MAIFAGTWLDGSGNPFDPTAHVTQNYTGGGAAAMTRTDRLSGIRRLKHIIVIGQLAYRWFNVLTPFQRSVYNNFTPNYWIKRDGTHALYGSGFQVYASKHYAEMYHFNANRTEPLGGYAFLNWGFYLEEAHAGSQTLTFAIDYEAGLNGFPTAETYVYQINPARTQTPAEVYNTRLADRNWTFDPAGGTYRNTVPAQFPILVGQLQGCLLRTRPTMYDEALVSHVVAD